MEWIGPLLIGILVLGGVFQLFWAYAISAIAQKTEQSEFMQVLAWIPLLQIAPTLAAGGGVGWPVPRRQHSPHRGKRGSARGGRVSR